MTPSDIQTAAAAYLSCSTADFISGGVNLFLIAMNQTRLVAEMNNDFEFSWARFSLSVPTSTGASLGDIVLVSGGITGCTIKTVQEVTQQDDTGNLRPVEWTTDKESFQRQRSDNPHYGFRYPTDGQVLTSPRGRARVTFAKNRVNIFPKPQTADTCPIFIDAYTFHPSWTMVQGNLIGSGATGAYVHFNGTWVLSGTYGGKNLYTIFDVVTATASILYYSTDRWIAAHSDEFPSATPTVGFRLITTSDSPAGSYTNIGSITGAYSISDGSIDDPWLVQGAQYLLWGSIVHLNFLRKTFVPRTEGNLPPPTTMRDEGLEILKQWDNNQYEQFRRHQR